MIANSSLGTPGARELIARTPRKVADDIVRRVNELTDGKTMSVQENAARIKAVAGCDDLRAMVEQMTNAAYDKINLAADALGDNHPGSEAITGQGVTIQQLGEQMVAAIGMLEFTMNNVADQLMGGS
jgi:hypothetical protein